MLVAEAASPKKGDHIIDMCAAPGGKSIHAADKMGDYGNVDARDVSQYKADLIKENIHRTGVINVEARVQDATVYDPDSEQTADIRFLTQHWFEVCGRICTALSSCKK